VIRSGRDEPIQVVIHMYMEVRLGICLYRHLYLELAKNCLSYYCLCLLFNKIGKEEGGKVLPESEGMGRRRRGLGQGEEMAQTMYAHMNK
jgi:hypothetical protein